MAVTRKNGTSTRAGLDLLQTNIEEAAALLHAIGNPNRLRVLCQLLMQGEMSVGEMNEVVGISASALSQHLARMRDEGLVAYRREAQTLYYRINNPAVERVIAALKDIYCP